MENKEEDKREIKVLIEKLTHSGEGTLNEEQLKRVKSICSVSEKNVQLIYNEIFKFLGKKHSEVRFSAVQLCNELFICNEHFHTLLLDNLLDFLKYTFEEPLPPPKAAAKKLIKLCITCIDNWNQKFGNKCYKIGAAYKYLRQKKNVDFELKEIVDPKKRLEEKKKEAKALLLNQQLLKKITAEIEDMKFDIETTITSLETGFDLLLPSPEEFNSDTPHTSTTDCSNNLEMRLFGVIDPQHRVHIQFNKDEKIEIKENEENSDILNAVKEAYTIISNRYLPKTKAWIEILSKVNDNSKNGVALMNRAREQENKLSRLISKYKMLKIITFSGQIDEVSSDSDLEEVVIPKPDKTSRQREEIGFLSDLLDGSKEKAATQIKGPNTKDVVVRVENRDKQLDDDDTVSKRKKDLLKVAPKLPYDIDLYHWEDEKLPTPTILAVNNEGARFWSGGNSDEISEIPIPGGSSVLRTRVIEFSGKFEPIERSCNYPLPSGKLCPRKDRIKCPFHGIIVDRDDKGRVINEEDIEKLNNAKPPKPVIPDWQDPKLLAEIKAAIGVDLKIPEKGQRKRKPKHPGLSDLNAIKKTPKARISKKIFNKASMKRVAAVMNNLERRRHRDKFGDQFNYVHNAS